MERSYKFSHAFYPEKNEFLSSEIPHRTHIIFLSWRLTKTLQQPFLTNFHVAIKIHLPFPLEYEVMLSLMKRETTLMLHSREKISSKCSNGKHRHFRKFCSSHASVCCDVTMARHIGQPRSRVYDSLLLKPKTAPHTISDGDRWPALSRVQPRLNYI